MRKRTILLSIIAVFLVGTSSSAIAGTYSGGSGEPNDPYLIATAEDMNQIGAEPNDWDAHFLLTADINLADYTAAQFNIIGTFYNTPFTGVFDGNSHTISNFIYTVVDTDYIGLFGYVDDANALIKNLTLTDPNIEAAGNSERVGAVVGHLNDGTLIGCDVEGGSVLGDSAIGGLVGENYYYGTISNCYATVVVSGDILTGGLVGSNNGTISNCYAAGSVSGDERCTGGLVGGNYEGAISNCYATGTVDGNDYTGGLVGWNNSIVSASFWDIETTGQSTSSGGEGKTTAEMQMMSTFFGWGCEPCVWTIDEANDYPRLAWEGKPGEPFSPTLSDFLDGAGTQNDPYLIYTADELNTIGLFSCELNKHFKVMADIDLGGFSGTEFNIIPVFTGVFDGNSHTISNFTYTTTNTYYIGLFGYVNDANALIKDLTLTDPNIEAAGNSKDVGAVIGWLRDGMLIGCAVEDGSVSGDNGTGGLVGENWEGTISNCYTTGAVSGYVCTGGLVGENYDGISNCYATGAVSGDNGTGGLVGSNSDGTISNCYATGAVSGDNGTGGLMGGNWFHGTISNCYATGAVSGNDDTGGLVGCNWFHGTISNCYAAGAIDGNDFTGGLVGYDEDGFFASCFWDTDVNPDVNGIGNGSDPNVIGKTTAEMKTESTFTDAGWDFTTPIWIIRDGLDYPRLWWIVIYVDDDAQPNGDGTSWANAYNYLQDALPVASNGYEIRIARGTYTPDRNSADPNGSGDREATFQLISGVAIYGGYAGFGEPDPDARDIKLYETILTGDLDGNDTQGLDPCDLPNDSNRGENSYHVVTGSGTEPTSILDGFIITGGNADGSTPYDRGGGFYSDSGSAVIRNCKFAGNMCLAYGGGLFIGGGGSSVIADCEIAGNHSQDDGGGMFIDDLGCTPLIENCIIKSNSAVDNGGGIRCDDYSTPTIRNCVITTNTSGDEGGGVCCKWNGSSAQIENCTITGNLANIGGAVYCIEASATINNCILWENTASNGEEIALRYSEYGPSTITVSYCDVQGSEAGIYKEDSNCTVNWGLGNIEADPCFADPCNDDYHLKSEGWRWDTTRSTWTWDDVTSRCIDAGNPGCVLGDEPLIVPSDPNNQWGENLRINMGAYGGTAEASIPPYDWALLADLTNDGVVDFEDYAFQAIDWLDSEECQPGDLDRNNLIDNFDLVLLVENWLETTSWYATDPCIPDDMAYIPDGGFEMGDHHEDGYSDELPLHAVLLDAFFMSTCEITNQQYCDYLNSAYPGQIKVVSGVVYASSDSGNSYRYCDMHSYDTDSQIDFSDPDFSVRTKGEPPRDMNDDPMVEVSWYGAAAYCNWRSSEEGYESCYNLSTWDCNFSKHGYRLPTEAEWEYAARGGEHSPYYRFPWGDTISHSQANYYATPGGYTYDESLTTGYHPDYNDVKPYTAPIGDFAANGYGLYDMAGNVYEWCNDWYDGSYYDVSPYDNPEGPASGTYRVLRGGGWSSNALGCRVAYRDYSIPVGGDYYNGFRIVLDLE